MPKRISGTDFLLVLHPGIANTITDNYLKISRCVICCLSTAPFQPLYVSRQQYKEQVG